MLYPLCQFLLNFRKTRKLVSEKSISINILLLLLHIENCLNHEALNFNVKIEPNVLKHLFLISCTVNFT